jgi:hypothetical protein
MAARRHKGPGAIVTVQGNHSTMAFKRAHPRLSKVRWEVLVPLVLFGDVILAALAWWFVGLILK